MGPDVSYFRPELIDFASLKKSNPELGIPRLLDAEGKKTTQIFFFLIFLLDVNVPRSDDKSIMTYLVSYYNYFTKMKFEETAGRRVAKVTCKSNCMHLARNFHIIQVIGKLLEIDKMQGEYDRMVTNLLAWIQKTIVILADRKFPNRLTGVQALVTDFKRYRTVEKPPK